MTIIYWNKIPLIFLTFLFSVGKNWQVEYVFSKLIQSYIILRHFEIMGKREKEQEKNNNKIKEIAEFILYLYFMNYSI